MTDHEFADRQRELEPKEDLSPYAGKWVALREGRVVASDIDPVRLREQAGVETEDIIVPVARLKGSYLIV